MEKSLAFYNALGFKTSETESNPPIVFFNNEGSKLELFPIEELAKDINPDNPPELSQGGFYGLTLAINMKEKSEVDEFFERVDSLGGKIVKKPETVSWGGYSGYFQDLDGYYWEVAYADTWKFDDNNMLVID